MKKRILSVLITLVMLIGLVSVMSISASAAGVTDEIHWAVVQKDSDVILYLGNAAHVMQTGETLYADGAQGTHNMVMGGYHDQPYEDWYMQITKVVVESEIQPASCAYWFYDLYNCTEMDLQLLNTGSVTSMKCMFEYCSSVTTLTWDTSKFTTANVTTMENMFSSCEELTSLDLSHFDTSNVTSMAKMFYQCGKLETLDLSSFDTSNVTNMARMFYQCKNLETLDLSSFDTSDVTDMAYMFGLCYDLAYLDLSNFDLSGIAASSNKSLFYGAGILTLKTPKINPRADAFGFTYEYSDEQGNLYTALPVSESAEGVKTLYKNSSIYYYMKGSTGGEGNPTRYAYDKAYSITLTVPQRAGYVFDGWKVDEGPEGVTIVGNTLTIPQYTTGTVYIDTLWKPYTVSVSGSYAPYTATIDPSRDDVTYSWHEYSFGSYEITDKSAIYDSEYTFGTYDPETGWTPDSMEYLCSYFYVSLKSGDTVTVTFADAVDVDSVAMTTGDWEYFFFGEAQAENVILFTVPEDGRYILVTNGIETTAKAIYAGISVSNTAAFTGTTFSTGEIGKQYVAKATFTDVGKEIVVYSAPFTYAEQYTVTFDYGTLGSETKTVWGGETVTPPAPVFGGKVLVGWYTDSSFATEFNFSDAINADNITVYAKFADYEGDKTELNNKIDAAKSDLQAKIDAVNSALAGKADAAALAAAIADLDAAKTDIQDLLDQIDDYAGADAALKNELMDYIDAAEEAIADTVDALTARVSALEGKLNGIDLSKIAENAGEIADLATELGDLSALVAALDGTYATDADLSTAIDTLESDIADAKSALEALIGGVQTDLTTTKAKLDKAIEDLTKAIAEGEKELSDEITALNTALANAKTALEKADTDNKAALESKIEAAEATLTAAIEAVEKDLDDAKAALNQAIAVGDTALDGKITALTEALANAMAALEAADSENMAEITAKIDEANAALESAIDALSGELNATNEKVAQLEGFITVVCVISVVALLGCGALAAYCVMDKKKKA